MLQQVYDIDFSHLVTKDDDARNASAISRKRLSRGKLTYFDLLLLSIRAINVAWYRNAIQILNIAATYFKSITSLERNFHHIYAFIVPYLTFVAKSGLLAQQNDPAFDIDSRLLPFSTSRFDHGNYDKA